MPESGHWLQGKCHVCHSDNTPKPNEQHGAFPPAFTLWSLRHVTSFIGLFMAITSLCCGSSSPCLLPLFAHPSSNLSLKPTISFLCSQISQCSPLRCLTEANGLAWPQRLRSELSLFHDVHYVIEHISDGALRKACAYTPHSHICTCI